MHTNEVLVLLGDNWFAERSAKQAAEIVDRRMKSKTISLVKVFRIKPDFRICTVFQADSLTLYLLVLSVNNFCK